jgi:hypothetical protein
MKTKLTKWFLMCSVMVSVSFSYTIEDLMDPSFQPFEDREINKWERARMIDELKEAQSNQANDFKSTTSGSLSNGELEVEVDNETLIKRFEAKSIKDAILKENESRDYENEKFKGLEQNLELFIPQSDVASRR